MKKALRLINRPVPRWAGLLGGFLGAAGIAHAIWGSSPTLSLATVLAIVLVAWLAADVATAIKARRERGHRRT